MDHDEDGLPKELRAMLDRLANRMAQHSMVGEIRIMDTATEKRTSWLRRVLRMKPKLTVTTGERRQVLRGYQAFLASKLIPLLDAGAAEHIARHVGSDELLKVDDMREQSWAWLREHRSEITYAALLVRPLEGDELSKALALLVQESFHREVQTYLPAEPERT